MRFPFFTVIGIVIVEKMKRTIVGDDGYRCIADQSWLLKVRKQMIDRRTDRKTRGRDQDRAFGIFFTDRIQTLRNPFPGLDISFKPFCLIVLE